MLVKILAIAQKDLEQIVKPLLDVLKVLVPVLLGLVGTLGMVWVIFLGVKYAKAEEPQERRDPFRARSQKFRQGMTES